MMTTSDNPDGKGDTHGDASEAAMPQTPDAVSSSEPARAQTPDFLRGAISIFILLT